MLKSLNYSVKNEKLTATFEERPSTSYEEGLLELYKKIRPGEPLSVDSAESIVAGMFFDARRYDLARVGRYKYNKKLAYKNRIKGLPLAEDVVDMTTGEVLAEAGTVVTEELAIKIQNAAVPSVMIQTDIKNEKVLSNLAVDINAYVDFVVKNWELMKRFIIPVLAEILAEMKQKKN